MINIIICDNDEYIHDDIKKMLNNDQNFKFNIINESYSTLDLVEYLEKNEDNIYNNTFLILDNYFDGIEAGIMALPKIRSLCPKLPILLLTSANFNIKLLKNIKPYDVVYFQKPISASTLRAKIIEMVEKINIIICDDDEYIHKDIKKMLCGYEEFNFNIVHKSYSTIDLVEYLDKNKDNIPNDTILLLDCYFNEIEEGLIALPRIRELCSKLHIILLTATEFTTQLQDDLQRYNVKYLQKPISADNLLFNIIDMVDNNDIHDLKMKIVDIDAKLDHLTDFVKNDLQNMINQEKDKLPIPDVFDDDDIKYDPVICEFISKLSKFINSHMDPSEELIREEIGNLSKRFGPYWSKLLDTSRNSLVSAEVIWKRCEDIEDTNFDYSGVCISATSALETELKKIFYDEFKVYIGKKYSLPSNANWQTIFHTYYKLHLNMTEEDFEKPISENSNQDTQLLDCFTMGTLPYLFGKKDNNTTELQSKTISTLMNDYLSTIVKRKYLDDPISAFNDPILKFNDSKSTSFIKECSNVRKKYRNKAAHPGIIPKPHAEICLHKIVGTEYSGIPGILITLYDIVE